MDDVRYSYLVETAAWGITEESLSAYPKGTRRLLYTRTQADPDSKLTVTKGPSLAGPTTEVSRVTRPGMLFLATAHRYGHETLTPVARGLMIGIGTSHLSFRDRQDQDVVKRVVMEMVAAPDLQTDLTRALVQTADLGIDHIEVRAEEIPEEVREQTEARMAGSLRRRRCL